MSAPTRRVQVIRDQQTAGAVNVVRFSSSGDYCLTGGADKTIKLYNPHKGQLIKSFTGGHGYEVLSLDITTDSSRFVSCGHDRVLFLWDVGTARILARFQGHHQRINSVKFNNVASAGSNVLVSGSYDATVRLWDIRQSRQPIQVLSDAKDSVSVVDVSAYEVLAGSVDGNVRVYDLRKGQLMSYKLPAPVTFARQTSDGACLLTSSLDGVTRLIDKETGDVLNVYLGHQNTKYRLENTTNAPTDTMVISGSENGFLHYWDFVEAQVISKVHAHSRAVLSVSYHPSRDMLLTSSADGHVILWDAPVETQ